MQDDKPTSIEQGRGRPPMDPALRKTPKDYRQPPKGTPVGRPKGFIVKEESKKKQSDSFLSKFQVHTPLGLFDSVHLAAEAHNISVGMIGYAIRMGKKQRELGKLKISVKGCLPNDWTDWYKVKNIQGRGTKGRPIKTPIGEFPTLTAAAKAYSITPSAMIRRIERQPNLYYYLDIE